MWHLAMKIFAFIPARYDSSRFPGKPLTQIAGKPMIQHVYERAISCPELSGVFVATDDKRILECVDKFKGKAVMTGETHRTGSDRICEAAQSVGLRDEDIVVNIQGDQPLFSQSAISDVVRPFAEDKNIQMTTLKYRIRDEREIQNPNHVKVVTDGEGYAIYFSRSPIPFFREEKSPTTYYKHLGFYGFRMDFLVKYTQLPEGTLESAEKLEQLRALECGFKIKVVETELDSVEVDLPEDVKKVEKLIRKAD
jgi:3-deoxy-manno-octulosonate cytidylyltransferase (CMP-KDO synthetase)